VGKGHFLARSLHWSVLELWGPGADGSFALLTSTAFSVLTRNSIVVNLGQERVLVFDQQTGVRRVHGVSLAASFTETPITPAIGPVGNLSLRITGRDMVALDDGHVLEWEPGTGRFEIWRYDRSREEETALVATSFGGQRDEFRRGHRLIPLGDGRLLVWTPITGTYRIRSFSWDAGSGDPFSTSLTPDGSWPLLTPDHEILLLDAGQLLIWHRPTGDLEVHAFEPLAPDPLTGERLLRREHHERLQSLPRGFMPETRSSIRRAVIVIQRGRSFDHHFGRYCQGTPGSMPSCTVGRDCCEGMPQSIPGADRCHRIDPAVDDHHPNDSIPCVTEKITSGNDFAVATSPGCGDPRDFACVDPPAPEPMATYHRLAGEGALADRFFQAVIGTPKDNAAVLLFASYVDPDQPWKWAGREAITSLLAGRHVPWAVYFGDLAEAVNVPLPIYYDGRWSHVRRLDEFAHDLEFRQLGAVSVIIPDPALGEMPGAGPLQGGIATVSGIVELIAGSPYRDDTLILIVHATAGGFYDHVRPPRPVEETLDPVNKSYGPRVPLLALGRFAKVNHVSHVTMEISSIAKFLEWNWIDGETGQLGGRDRAVSNIGDLLDPAAAGMFPVPSGDGASGAAP
jgi:hypothetical protein